MALLEFSTNFVGAMKMDAFSFGLLCLWLLFYAGKQSMDEFYEELSLEDINSPAQPHELCQRLPRLDYELVLERELNTRLEPANLRLTANHISFPSDPFVRTYT